MKLLGVARRCLSPVAIVLVLASPLAAAGPPVPEASVLGDTADLLLGGIFRTTVEAGKLPVEWAKPLVVRWKLKEFVAGLPLPPAVAARVRARIDAPDFVDGIVPFVAELANQYAAPKDDAPEGFDARARRVFDRSLPGAEHALFTFAPKKAPAKGEKSAGDPAVAAAFVRLYDALFLAGGPSPFDVESRADAASVARAKPVVADLLRTFASRGPKGSETRAALEGILGDPERLEAVTVSLVEAIDRLAFAAWQRFAGRALRERDLERWLLAELEKERGGAVGQYLRWAREERRFAVEVVVDGLEGSLVEALAKGEKGDPFLRAIAEEDRNPPAAPAGLSTLKPAPRMHTAFLRSAAAAGFRHPEYLPFFRRLYGAPGGAVARGGYSTTPTISVRNLPIVETGATVAGSGGTGIPNFHFLDRPKDRAWYFYGNDALALHDLVRAEGLRTMFERLPGRIGVSGFGQYDRGAAVSWDPFANLVLGEKQRDWGERRLAADLFRRATTERRLDSLRAELVARLSGLGGSSLDPRRAVTLSAAKRLARRLARETDDGIPDHLLWYDPWPDHFAHFHGPFSDEIVGPTGELNRLDHWLGRVERAYRLAGVSDRTLFGMAGDHGLVPVFHLVRGEAELAARLAGSGVMLEVRKISADEGEGPRLVHPWRPPSMRGADLVAASTAGGSLVFDFFVDQGSGWARQPVAEELRSLGTIGGRRIDAIAETLAALGGALDYLVVRERSCDASGGAILALGPRGGTTASARIERRGDRVRVRQEGDLLGLTGPGVAGADAALLARCLGASSGDDPAAWCREEEWTRAAAVTRRPDVVVQLAHLCDVDTAGTMNLFPARGVAWNSVVPGRHAGELFEEKDAFVGFFGPPTAGAPRPGAVANGSVAPTLYEWLTGRPARAGEEGWGWGSRLGEVVRRSPPTSSTGR